ncbi:MAG: hypothetical protein LC658_12890, partial [Bacteroidales bacterium]|nr:hypothetical protein [Bacteroidales bacterium]
MNTIELKNNLHQLIDSINNDHLLSRFYSLMVTIKNQPEGKLWNRLSQEDKDELLLSDMESNDPENLIPYS